MFEEIPANTNSLTHRKLICGVGVNNADYLVQPEINGKQQFCPYYLVWKTMIQRCYDQKLHKRRPTYKDCTVCNEWLIFSSFKNWMKGNNWEGMELDKDLRIIGCKEYSPSSCSFVPSRINTLLLDCRAARGKYYKGVSLHKPNGKFVARCGTGDGKRKSIGYFKTELKAYQAYLRKKAQVIRSAVEEYATELHPEVINTLNTKANQNINLAYYL